MASARIARFATEAAPPQFVTVMRQRASKMLDTIHEEDQRDIVTSSDSPALQNSHLQPSSSKTMSIMPQKFISKAFKGRISVFSR